MNEESARGHEVLREGESPTADERDGPAPTGQPAEGEGGEGALGTESASKFTLRRLKIHKFRNVLPGTELHFGDGIHALLGKNGTGKTTLLKLISMCVRGSFAGLQSEDLEIECDLQIARDQLSIHIKNESRERAPAGELLAKLTAHGGVSAPLTQPDYWFRVVFQGHRGEPITAEGTQTAFTVNGLRMAKHSSVSPFLPLFLLLVAAQTTGSMAAKPTDASGSLSFPDNVFSFLHASIRAARDSPFRFDEADGFLLALEGTASDERTGIAPLTVTVVQTTPWDLRELRWVPVELQTFLKRQHGEPPSVAGFSVTSSDLSFLKRYAELAGFDEVIMTLSLQSRVELPKKKDGYVWGRCRFLVKLHNGEIISHDALSFGQRRLLAFLYYAACNPSILIADELTNGLHHEWIEACVDELEARQSFIATQNPLLLDYLPIESAEQVRLRFIQCHLVEDSGKRWMSWRSTTEKEATSFYESYQIGIRHVSEILRAEGLW